MVLLSHPNIGYTAGIVECIAVTFRTNLLFYGPASPSSVQRVRDDLVISFANVLIFGQVLRRPASSDYTSRALLEAYKKASPVFEVRATVVFGL